LQTDRSREPDILGPQTTALLQNGGALTYIVTGGTNILCMMTASAPAGTGAPVKIRAALPGTRIALASPAAMRCDNGSRVAPLAARSAVLMA
jgi:hypothetical protein